ncbi:hypothetical protein M231_02345 [Tremella mesenterica]|uniref:Uncharacterized protein n=1 Tax=Tremella mesenterica TaxID=5217 RepID=A0A4Q1BR77_TREME|nr:uncharacterized protein TREMEDRAFT_64488 [Tremella mesenterica DSM 1558]EIW67240.1 hypothetical protein TREMEDRAFT_64488 [Tremella mesenterica DSM 1558]RXK40362.1 hypothetical protein M231_02345 [Tremella mesenterica]
MSRILTPINTTPSPSRPTSFPTSPTPSLNPAPPPLPASLQILVYLLRELVYWANIWLDRLWALVHDLFYLGLTIMRLVEHVPMYGSRARSGLVGEGKAVVIIGAKESIGQHLTLRLAKLGYTVFPLLPQPSTYSPPTSQALASLLLTWGDIKKHLLVSYPRHPGAVVPVMTDPEPKDWPWTWSVKSALKITGRLEHAGETIRAYCRDHHLCLVGIVCTPRGTLPPIPLPALSPSPPSPTKESQAGQGLGLDVGLTEESSGSIQPKPITNMIDLSDNDITSFVSEMEISGGNTSVLVARISQAPDQAPTEEEEKAGTTTTTTSFTPRRRGSSTSPALSMVEPDPDPAGLGLPSKNTLHSLFTGNVIEPVAMIGYLGDLLGNAKRHGKGKGKVIFINDLNGAGVMRMDEREGLAMRSVGGARREAIKGLRKEHGRGGLIAVCEIVAGRLIRRRNLSPEDLPDIHLRTSTSHSKLPKIPQSNRPAPFFPFLHTPTPTPSFHLPPTSTILTSFDPSNPGKGPFDPSEHYIATRQHFPPTPGLTPEQVLDMAPTIVAIDEHAIFCAVDTALKCRHARDRSYVGWEPLIRDWVGWIPGSGLVWWMVCLGAKLWARILTL